MFPSKALKRPFIFNLGQNHDDVDDRIPRKSLDYDPVVKLVN